MAKRQDGFYIRKRTGVKGASWTVQVWDHSAGAYGKSKTFAARKFPNAREAEREALRWAREQVTESRAGLATPNRGSGVLTKEALADYIEDQTRRGANPTHLANLRRRLGSLPRYCVDLAADDAPRQVYAWWQAWGDEPKPDGTPKAPGTRNNGLTDCKAFLSWCSKASALTGLRAPLDVEWIRPLREDQLVPPVFTVDELAAGLRMTAHPFRIRWALYAYLGARRSEALRLKWEHFTGGHVLLSGKGRKQRLVPVGPELSTILRIYRRSEGSQKDGFLFPASVRLDDGGNLARRFDAFLRAAGIPKAGRSTHSLRHSYAGLMTATGEPTALLQAYMGHAAADMTIHYAQMAARYRQEVAGWGRGVLLLLRSTSVRPEHANRMRGPWTDSERAWLVDNWARPMADLIAHLGRGRAAIYKYGRTVLGLPGRAHGGPG